MVKNKKKSKKNKKSVDIYINFIYSFIKDKEDYGNRRLLPLVNLRRILT